MHWNDAIVQGLIEALGEEESTINAADAALEEAMAKFEVASRKYAAVRDMVTERISPDCMEFGFGVDSFRRHLRIARNSKIVPVVAKLPGIGLDVDTPDDLRELIAVLLEQDLETRTRAYLVESDIINRAAVVG